MNKELSLKYFILINVVLVFVIFYVLSLSVFAQKADFGSATSTFNIATDLLPPELKPLYELVTIPSDLIIP